MSVELWLCVLSMSSSTAGTAWRGKWVTPENVLEQVEWLIREQGPLGSTATAPASECTKTLNFVITDRISKRSR